MAKATLTSAQATKLYTKGLAFLDGIFHLTTRTALYEWDATAGHYELTHDGLRIVHSIGATWNGRRFVRCACAHCTRYADLAAQVDIAEE
jgi:hypothetical protein